MSTNAYITPGQGTFTDDAGNTYQLDINGNAMEKLAGQSTFGLMNNGNGTAAMEIYSNIVYAQDRNSGNWFQWNGSDFTGPVTAPPTVGPVGPPPPPPPPPPPGASGAFTVGGGKITDPNGNPWRAYGINIWEDVEGNAVTNAACTPMTTFFPGINFVRTNIHTYQAASQTATYVTRCTAQKIVVLFEDHTGISAAPLTGTALQTEVDWYASVATAYKDNPYVWFGSWNEPGNQAGANAVSQQHLAVYNAIRNTGNNNPIFMDPIGGGNPSTLGDLTASVYLGMTNIGWDMHFYNWMTSNSADQTVNDNKLASMLTTIQGLKSKDGVMPVIIGEYGDSSSGDTIDAGWRQCVTAVINNTTHSGSAAWEWAHLGNGDNLLNPTDTALTAYGQLVANYIKQNVAPPQKQRVVAPLTGNVTTGTWTKVDITVPGVTLPSGKQVHFEILLPAQYNPNVIYPIMFWLHPNNEGNGWYTSDPGVGPISALDANGFYNTVNFRTNYPSICIVAYADQTTDSSGGALENFGGWANDGTTGTGTHFSGDTGPNVFATIGVLQYVLANYAGDSSRVYISGFSLGGIGAEYLMLKYNQVNGNPPLFTSAMSTGGVLEVHGWGSGPTNADAGTMTNVPVWWVSGGNDGESQPSHWNLPMWRSLAGNSNYPAPGTSATAAKAGTSQYRFWYDTNIGHQQTDQSGNPYPTNTTILNFMYSQVGATIAPPPPPPPPPAVAGWTAVSGDPRLTPGAMVSSQPSLMLSNRDLTVTTVDRTYQGVKSTTSNFSGKFYFEVTCNNLTPSFAIGISTANYDLTASIGLGMDLASVGFYPVSPPQGIYSGSPDTGLIGYNEDSNGDVLSCAVDFSAGLIWFSSPAMRQAGPLWNNVAGADPVNGIGGIQIPITGLAYFVTFTDKNGGAIATINLGASDFNQVVPVGFASWSSGVE